MTLNLATPLGSHDHHNDRDCRLAGFVRDGDCLACGVTASEPCFDCKGRRYHEAGCPSSDEPKR